MKKIVMLFMISLLFFGCGNLTGEEIGRIQINQISTDENLVMEEVTLDLLKGDEIALWSDMDFEYEGDGVLVFKMGILKNDELYNELEFNPTEKNITIGEVKTTLMGKTSWSFTGKNGEVVIDEDASYTFKGILVSNLNPTIKVEKAEIVLKR